MNRPCSKCNQGNMRSETQPIPKKVPLPYLGAINIPVEDYMPYMMRGFRNYTVFICDTCRNLEFAVSWNYNPDFTDSLMNPFDLVLISVVFVSLLISRVFGKFLTLQRVGSAAGIIVGIIVVLQFIPIDPTMRTIFSSIGLIIILCLVTIFIIIPYFRSSNRLALTGKLISQKLKWRFSNKPPVFDAEMVNRKEAYVRGTDSVSFRSRFRGNLTNG